jgi:hypothetical protein
MKIENRERRRLTWWIAAAHIPPKSSPALQLASAQPTNENSPGTVSACFKIRARQVIVFVFLHGVDSAERSSGHVLVVDKLTPDVAEGSRAPHYRPPV